MVDDYRENDIIDVENQREEDLDALHMKNIHEVDKDQLAALSRTLSRRSKTNVDEGLSDDDKGLEAVLRRQINANTRDGILDRAIGVKFKGLSVYGVDMSTTSLFTLSEVLMAPLRIGNLFSKSKVQHRALIRDFHGVIDKGEMLLVLGRPGAGCSTFLRTLAGETDAYTNVEGELAYDGIDQKTMKQRFKGDLLYSAETDEHMPTLNVSQTLSFAAEVKSPYVRSGNVSRDEFIKDTRDILATVFGLTHTYNTPVGNDFVRGVSGGERKRVSLAEVLAGRANFVCWDNSTRGLDASTALEYTETIRTVTNLLQNTAVVAIYQAGENIYNLFDKVTVIHTGRQIYFGHISKAKQFFVDMGYYCPPRQTTAEFLTAITDPAGRFVREGYENRVPVTADEFETYWKNSPEFQEIQNEISQYEASISGDDKLNELNASASQERSKGFLKRNKSPYVLSIGRQLLALIRRGFQRQRGNRAFTISSLVASFTQSLIFGSLFYNIPKTVAGSFSRGGIIFFAILFFTLNAIAEMAMQYPDRKVVEKQKRFAFYHPGLQALAYLITTFPERFAAITIFELILYFMTNLNRKPGQFFIFYLFVQLTTLTMVAFFQMVSSFSPTLEAANAIAGMSVLLVFIYAGYLIPRPLMKVWFSWMTRMNPVSYSFEALMANEFHGAEIDCTASMIPQGEGISLANQVCSSAGGKTSQIYVLGDDYVKISFLYKFSHVWRNFGILIVFFIAFVIMYMVGTEIMSPAATKGDVLIFRRGYVPEVLEEKEKNAVAAGVVRDAAQKSSGSSSSSTVEADSPKETAVIEDGDVIGKIPSRVNSSLRMTEIFSWQHVNYTVTLPNGEDRQLLCDVQGFTKPGTMTALMGESGAGKTTLLNTLAQRIDVGVITGDMLVDGKALSAGFKRRTGYVQQQDLHVAETTVREALRFAALLRQPASVPTQEKYDYVETVIEMLGMESYAEAIVGNLGAGLNVEQRKKLSVGVELASKPSLLLFLDEPTSGLDSQSAWAIVQLLRRLANAGQSILCTIHQPSATLFEEFDRLLLLKKGGKTVYFGDIGTNSRTLVNYFETQGAPKCGSDENPAEYILNCIGAGATAVTDRDWYDVWTASENFSKVTREIEELHAELSQLPAQQTGKDYTGRFAVPWTTQARAVITRTFQQYWRNPSYIMAKGMLYIVSGLYIGFSFWDTKFTIQGVSNLLFGVFLPIVLAAPLMNQMQPQVLNIRELYLAREAASNTYHWSCLQLSTLVAEMPFNIVLSTIQFCCFYFPVHFFREASRAGFYYLVFCILYPMFWASFGISMTVMAPNAATANIITSVMFSMILSFSGIFQPYSLFPGFWKFMYRVSPYTYFIESLLSTVLHDGVVTCSESELSIFQPPSGQTCYEFAGAYATENMAKLSNPNATSDCGYCRWTVADQYLTQVNIKYSHRWRNVGFICAFILFNVAFTFVGFKLFQASHWSLPKFGKKKAAPAVKKTESDAEKV
ncbi:ABC-2 type transporter-domain-containing protein [Lipomyces oligophaga]|uniref:ABC-2 type transporter-domain-containing protein n=1 Tax=Lipomyces oligophaga TaxID=45792 RepID=UPI0034CF4342